MPVGDRIRVPFPGGGAAVQLSRALYQSAELHNGKNGRHCPGFLHRNGTARDGLRADPNGWGWENFLAEANEGKGLKIAKWLRPYMTYVLPVIVSIILIFGLYNFFAA